MGDRPVAIVTGAAGGLGSATSLAFARAGHDLAVTDIDANGLDRLSAELKKSGSVCLAVPGDIADLRFAESFIKQADADLGRIDVLVNNAAWRDTVTMRQISVESWEKTMRIGLTVPAFLSRWAAESMEKRRKGVIINIASMNSRQAGGIAPAYVASKGGLNTLTYELAALYGPSGIRVLGIDPGAIDTAMSRDISPGKGRADDPVHEYSTDMIALGRWAQPEEIASLIVALAGDAGSYVTGTVVLADGGWHHQSMPMSLKKHMTPGQF
jgi:NAD(P)-dependent dehydrogenase (short-subunit alcohol dehydrogenase family)